MQRNHVLKIVFALFAITPHLLYPSNTGGRLTIVAAVKHKQLLKLYDYLAKHAKNFDPRYAGSLKTNSNPHDPHKNLHITLASTNVGPRNEKACKTALKSISGFYPHKIHVRFNAKQLRLDAEHHVILPVKKDSGYKQLLELQNKVVQSLKRQKAMGIHAKPPNHVTIGFASKLPKKKFLKAIPAGTVTHARLYLWKGNGAQAYPPREEFYPKKEVRIYRDKNIN